SRNRHQLSFSPRSFNGFPLDLSTGFSSAAGKKECHGGQKQKPSFPSFSQVILQSLKLPSDQLTQHLQHTVLHIFISLEPSCSAHLFSGIGHCEAVVGP